MKMIEYPPCKYCGASHGMGIENMKTGEIKPLDICKECLWKDSHINPVTDQIIIQTEEEMHKELGILLVKTLNKNYGKNV
jgi:hypothetical protein